MESYLLRGICIGLLFGLPVGAVGALTVQRTLAYGPRMGIITGLGSSAADCLYAIVGAFGLTFISDFLMRNQVIINIIGGGFVLVLGVQMFLRKPEAAPAEHGSRGKLRMFASSFAIGITNPAAVLTFLFAFSWFGIAGPLRMESGAFVVLGVFVGTLCWWVALSGCAAALRRRLGERAFVHMNRLFGSVLVMFGIVVWGRTFFAG